MRPLSRTLLVYATLVLAGCTDGTAPAAFPTVTLRNATAEPIAYFAVSSDDVPLLDPVPVAAASQLDIVEAGADKVVAILGLDIHPQPMGVAVVLYRVRAARDSADFARVVVVTRAELVRTGGRVTVSSLNPLLLAPQ